MMCLLFSMLLTYGYSQAEWKTFNKSNSGLPSDTVNSIAIQSDGSRIIGTNAGLVFFDGINWTVFNRRNSPLPGDTVQAIYIDGQGNKWICTNNGLACLSGIQWKVFDLPAEGVTVKSFCAMTMDTAGILWLGSCSNGLVYSYIDSKWNSFSLGGFGQTVFGTRQIVVAPDNSKWFASNGCGILEYNDNTWNIWIKSTSGLPNNSASSIVIDSLGNKWIGTYTRIMKADSGLKTWTTIKSITDTRAMMLDKNGVLWAGTYGGGLFDYNGQTWKQDTVLPDKNVKCLAIDHRGTKWIGTQKGLTTYNENGLGTRDILPASASILVFPNPSSDILNIRCGRKPISAMIYSIRGEFIRSLSLENGLNQSEIRSLSEGIYLLRVIEEGSTRTVKFVKQ